MYVQTPHMESTAACDGTQACFLMSAVISSVGGVLFKAFEGAADDISTAFYQIENSRL